MEQYQLSSWTVKDDGTPVSDEERRKKASSITLALIDHNLWKSHGHGISANEVENVCGLNVTKIARDDELCRALRRLWAVSYYIFSKAPIAKIYLADDYFVNIQKSKEVAKFETRAADG